MDNSGVKEIVKFLQKNCHNELSSRQYEQLRLLYQVEHYTPHLLRKLFSIAISACVYPECAYCQKPINRVDELSIDHIYPKSRGGQDNVENLQPMHAACNSRKGNEIPELVISGPTHIEKGPRTKRRLHRTENLSGHDVDELRQKCEQADNIRAHRFSVAQRSKHR